ncbi:hypothetical protein ACROYT_G032573 [Oculina patagonica]
MAAGKVEASNLTMRNASATTNSYVCNLLLKSETEIYQKRYEEEQHGARCYLTVRCEGAIHSLTLLQDLGFQSACHYVHGAFTFIHKNKPCRQLFRSAVCLKGKCIEYSAKYRKLQSEGD